MNKLIKKALLFSLLCISGFFGTLQNVQGQSSSHDNLRTSLHDSLRTMLSHLEKVSSNEKLKHNIEKVLDVYTGDKMDIFLLIRLLEIDNQLIDEAQPNQPIFLTYAETLLRILEKLPPEKENVYYIAGLNNLAILCLNMGQYDKVLPLYQQALFTTSKVFSKQHPYYTSGLNNLAAFYELIGRYDEALGAYQQVIDILKKAGEEEKPRIAPTLMNLADLHRKMGQPEKALHLLQQALEILKKTKGEKLPEYPICLESLAVSYLKMGQHNEAFHLLQEALIIREKTLTKEHPDYANTLVNLAFFYRSTGREDSALHLYNKALVILKNAVSEEHPDVVNVMNDIGTLYAASGNTAAALSLFIQGNNNTLRHLSRTYSTLSEQENITYLNKKSSQFNFLPSLLYLHDTVRSDAVTQLYQSELILKGMVLENQKAVLSGIRKSGDSIAQHLYEQWRTNKAILGKQLLLSIRKRLPNLDSLGEATNQKEQQLSRNSRVFRNQVQSQRLTAKNVAQKLAKEEAAIEFIRFPFYNKKKTDSVMYAALVLLPQDTVAHFVPLFEEKQLQRLLTRPTASLEYDAIHHLYGHESKALGDSLYRLVWQPLEQYLTGISTVYYAPAGLLHRVAFQALGSNAEQLLVDKYRLNQVLSTRSVVVPVEVNSKPKTAAVWGNIQYTVSANYSIASRGGTRGINSTNADTTLSAFALYNEDTRGLRGEGWKPLPFIKLEMDNLKKLFTKANIPVTTLSGKAATEEAFKALDGDSQQVLHMGTHGFFLPVKEKKIKDSDIKGSNPFTAQQNPMFRSGLVLAGGNRAWKGDPGVPGKEDGILTAYDIAHMDLSGTDLVVLSACETALGDLQGNEGVIGLQRAFKMAGVKQIIASLWEVNDKATAELMTHFYKNWLSGQTTREALHNAQLKLKEKKPSPYYWAAFVLVE